MTALCQQLIDFGLKSKETEETKKTKEIRKTEDSSLIPVRVLNRHHKHIQQKSCGRCEWGKLYSPGCPRKRLPKKRKFGIDITSATLNGVRGYFRRLLRPL
jgi:sulfatase maturation enzyme AslB (radical SAM superfamily)